MLEANKVVDVTNITKHFGHREVLHHLSFSLSRGRIIGLVGPNGAGKTTLMKILLGLVPIETGNVRVAGYPVTNQQHKVIQKQVGALIEHPALYPFLSGEEHLHLLTNDTIAIDHIIAELGMERYRRRLAKHYSLGMKQKLGIAMALINQPSLVVLDEPMNGLDPQSVKMFRSLIQQRAAAGTTFLISSHILSELEKVVDDILVISEGHLLLQTTMAALQQTLPKAIVIKTNNDAASIKILREGHYLISGSQLILTGALTSQLDDIIRKIQANNLQILSIQERGNDLETVLLRQLAQEREEA